MKSQILIITILFISLTVSAQDNLSIFQKIEKAGASITSLECEIDNIRLKSGKERTKHGMLYYQANDKLATNFENGDYAIFNGIKTKINIGIFRGTFRTNRDNIFCSLSNMLFCAIQGRCIQVAQSNKFDYSIKEENGTYIVYFDSREKSTRGIGYKKVVFIYGTNDYRLRSIIMTDYKGTTNTFNLSKPKYDETISADKFKL